MFRKLKRELDFIGDNIPMIAVGAFVFAMGGVLLWVSGGAGMYYLRCQMKGSLPSLAVIFSVWLTVYALCGVVTALLCIIEKTVCVGKRRLCFKPALLSACGYIFSLVYYALFFCTRLVFFSLLMLILSAVLFGIIFVVTRKTFVTLTIAVIMIEIAEIYFIYFSLSKYLLN